MFKYLLNLENYKNYVNYIIISHSRFQLPIYHMEFKYAEIVTDSVMHTNTTRKMKKSLMGNFFCAV